VGCYFWFAPCQLGQVWRPECYLSLFMSVKSGRASSTCLEPAVASAALRWGWQMYRYRPDQYGQRANQREAPSATSAQIDQ
jgi:hypothetical protein